MTTPPIEPKALPAPVDLGHLTFTPRENQALLLLKEHFGAEKAEQAYLSALGDAESICETILKTVPESPKRNELLRALSNLQNPRPNVVDSHVIGQTNNPAFTPPSPKGLTKK